MQFLHFPLPDLGEKVEELRLEFMRYITECIHTNEISAHLPHSLLFNLSLISCSDINVIDSTASSQFDSHIPSRIYYNDNDYNT